MQLHINGCVLNMCSNTNYVVLSYSMICNEYMLLINPTFCTNFALYKSNASVGTYVNDLRTYQR